MTVAKVESFTDLVSWQHGHRLVVAVYQITNDFPTEERFGLISQIRQSAVSVTSNIAEGFSSDSSAEMAQFYTVALGSLTELQNQMLVARDVGYISPQQFTVIASLSVNIQKLLHGTVRSVKQGKGRRVEPINRTTSNIIINQLTKMIS